MRPAALQIIAPEGEVDASGARPRARVPVAHLSSEKIAEALKASNGVIAEAARRLRISRDTLHERLRVDPVVEAARNEAREVFLDLGESELAKLVKAGVPSAVFFLLRTLGARRGWREGVVVEQEEAPRRRVDMSSALRALTPTELQQLEQIVSKLEGAARLEARERDADERDARERDAHERDAEGPRRRRAYLRGEVAAAVDAVAEVEAVEAVAAPDEAANRDGVG